jgi:tetratricopeptide (TPR) repeat protein
MAVSSQPPSADAAERAAVVHRETIQLGLLVVIAIGLFLLTRAVAASNRALTVSNAAQWYARGEELLRTGHIDEAIAAFRRATVRNRDDRTYVLALARALVIKGDYDAAAGLLARIRESAPEDAQINLDLAHVAAAREDVSEAVRYFHDALYASWPIGQEESRRHVRLDLIRFLLAQNQGGRAEAELLAAGTDMPDDAADHAEIATLFAQAGDDRRALDHYQQTLRLKPDNAEALADAGTAAFRLGQYALAQQYFRKVPARSDVVRTTGDIVDLVLSCDPMAAHIGSHERQRRLERDVAYTRQRLEACVALHPVTGNEDSMIQSHLQALDRQFLRPAPLDQDTLEARMDLIARAERKISERCGPVMAMDQALLLIAREHGASSK